MSSNPTILITGGCGFIGTALISRLSVTHPEAQIRILDNHAVGTPEDLAEVTIFSKSTSFDTTIKERVVLIQGDIRSTDTAIRCAQGVDCIVHLAANTGVASSVENPVLDMECNVIGTLNMLEAARFNEVKTFIFASSGAPAGEVEPPIHEELPPHPISPYGASKLAGEGYCSAYYKTYGVNTICLRFGNVYGPRSKRKSSVIAKFIQRTIFGEPCVIYGDGTQTRDFIFIDDLVEAIVLCLAKNNQRSIAGEIFQIATGKEHTVSEVAQIISSHFFKKGISMAIRHDQPRQGDLKRNFADTRKAKRFLNWRAQVPLEKGVEKTIEYFLARELGTPRA